MKPFLSILTTFLLCSCSEPLADAPGRQPERVVVHLSLYAADAEPRSRSTDEDAIADVNLYLVNPLTEEVVQVYTHTPSAQFSCAPGDYELYAIANLNANTGHLSYDELRSYAVEQPAAWDLLPMTVQHPLRVLPSASPVELEPLALRRFAARITYDIRVSEEPAAEGIRLDSVQAMSVPTHAALFSGAKPDAFTDYPIIHLREGGNSLAGTFYMLPNCQGTVESITQAHLKNPENAPVHATYLRIRARHDHRVLDYYVYLGDNDTSDFNVRPNTQHTLRITIRGESLTDVRLRPYSVHVEATTTAEQQDGFFLNCKPISLAIYLSGEFRIMKLRGMLELVAGDTASFQCNDLSHSRTYPLILEESDGYTAFNLVYNPPRFTASSATLHLRVHIYDRYGPVSSFDFVFPHAYLSHVYTSWYVDAQRYGNPTCQLRSEVPIIRSGTLSSTYYKVYSTCEGCTLEVLPAEPYPWFAGWYADPFARQRLSTEPKWHYIPDTEAPERTIYAYTY